jgi:hypothetical protein
MEGEKNGGKKTQLFVMSPDGLFGTKVFFRVFELVKNAKKNAIKKTRKNK